MSQEQQLQEIRERWSSAARVPWGVISFRSPRLATADQEIVDISIWSAPREAYDAVCVVHGDIATLLRMIDERDAIIHDMMIDGSALARRAVEEFASGLVEWIRSKAKECQANARADKYWAGEIMGLNLVAVHLLDHSPTPDPLPPDQARAEAERLRVKLRAVVEHIDSELGRSDSWVLDAVLGDLKRLASEDAP